MTRARRAARWVRRRHRRGDEAGNAMIEFVVLGILTLIPLIYLVIAAFTVERNVFAVTQAAREAGRAYATAPDDTTGRSAASAAVALALADQRVSDGGVQIEYVPVGSDCTVGRADAASHQPGSEFTVCVRRAIEVPGVPGFLDARRNTATGAFVVHVDDYQDTGDATP